MKISTEIKDLEKKVEAINRAEELIKELKDIFLWDLSGEITLEVKGPSERADSPNTEINS